MDRSQKAISLLKDDVTCVICKEDKVYTSKERGVAPLVKLLYRKEDISGCYAADKVVGKACALLYVLAGAKWVYAPVMSAEAGKVFTSHGVEYQCLETVSHIINRKKTGICPMEETVADIDHPKEAFMAIMKKMDDMNIKYTC